VAALAAARTRSAARLDAFRWPVLFAGAVVAVALLVPLAELLWLAMSLAAAPALGAVLGLIAVMVLPALEPSRSPYPWATSIAFAVVAGGFLAVGVSRAVPSPERPAPSTMIYTLDRGDGRAAWATDGSRPAGHPGMAWALARVDGFGEPASLADFGLGERAYRFAPAEAVDLPPPAVDVALDTAAVGALARVSVRSAIGSEAMGFVLSDEGPDLRALNGEAVPNAERVTYADHWGAPEDAVQLSFVRSFRDDRLDFVIVEHMLRPSEIVGEEAFRRPPHLAPDITRLSDRVLVRTPVTVDLVTGAVEVAGRPAAAGPAEPAALADSASAADSTSLGDPMPAADSTAAGESTPAADAASTADSATVSEQTGPVPS
jgi:hypothetical protein